MVPQEPKGIRSPLSDLTPKKICDLPQIALRHDLELQFGARPPAAVVETDYSLWQCVETGLQFAWPMLPGNAAFYQWVSSFSSYYPGLRWEYRKIRDILKTENRLAAGAKILDAGSGKGDFLKAFDLVRSEHKYALDLNEPAVETCRKQGFQAFCGTMKTALDQGVLKAGDFAVVTSFHCLEHVPEPVSFVRELLQVTAPGGRVFVSTPYSPMSTEENAYDILNLPPHHLTRWNLAAYQQLAKLLGAKMRYFVPSAGPFIRALKAFWVNHHGPNQPIDKTRLLADLTFHFPEISRLYRKHMDRQKANGGIGADVILVEFTVN